MNPPNPGNSASTIAEAQYQNTTKNLERRIAIYKYSTNPQSWLSFVASYISPVLGTSPKILDVGAGTGELWKNVSFTSSADLTLADLAIYIRSIQPRPNRWKLPGYELTPAQERGKAIFERTVDKFKKPIPEYNRCSFCHSGPKGTSQKIFDVGTRKPTDNTGLLKAPMLTNIALTAPYLHDGSARSLEEIWTVYNPDDKHGRTNDLTKDELNDLIEYLRSR